MKRNLTEQKQTNIQVLILTEEPHPPYVLNPEVIQVVEPVDIMAAACEQVKELLQEFQEG